MIDLSNKKDLYHVYKKKKANGKVRIIYAPCEELKSEQERLAKWLEEWYNFPSYVVGFIKGRSVVDAAKLHTNKDWVISMDIKDFFPSITKEMISDIMSPDDCEIATLNDRLVQGSPCSPVISNIIFKSIDLALSYHFDGLSISYSRYADDIVISGFGKPKWEYVNTVSKAIAYKGFELSKKKTKFMLKKDKQTVLGITVNTGISISQKERKKLRAIIHQGNLTESDEGYLSYINSVNKDQYNKLKGL